MSSFLRLPRLALGLGLGLLSLSAFAGEQPDEGTGACDTFSLQLENDEFGNSDRHYTGGLRVACVRPAPRFIERRLRNLLPEGGAGRYRASYGLGQNVYTPDDIAEFDLIEDDQPYAGWLYLDFGFETEVMSPSGGFRYVDNLGLQLGVIGPLSGAEQFQRYSHDVLNASEPEGWDNQLDNEPGVNLFYSRQWTGLQRYRMPFGARASSFFFDVTPKIGAAFGNVYINGATGLTLRFGHFQPNDHGPTAIRPSFPGSDGFPKEGGWSAYLFGGVEGRVVGRNIFLDGNSFDDDSPSVEKNTLVGEARLGVVMSIGAVRLAYAHVFRSQEFDGQEPQTYGSVTLAFGF